MLEVQLVQQLAHGCAEHPFEDLGEILWNLARRNDAWNSLVTAARVKTEESKKKDTDDQQNVACRDRWRGGVTGSSIISVCLNLHRCSLLLTHRTSTSLRWPPDGRSRQCWHALLQAPASSAKVTRSSQLGLMHQEKLGKGGLQAVIKGLHVGHIFRSEAMMKLLFDDNATANVIVHCLHLIRPSVEQHLVEANHCTKFKLKFKGSSRGCVGRACRNAYEPLAQGTILSIWTCYEVLMPRDMRQCAQCCQERSHS